MQRCYRNSHGTHLLHHARGRPFAVRGLHQPFPLVHPPQTLGEAMVPLIFYIAGSVCFLVGSVISLVEELRG